MVSVYQIACYTNRHVKLAITTPPILLQTANLGCNCFDARRRSYDYASSRLNSFAQALAAFVTESGVAMTTIAISGIKGSFSEEAASKFLKDQNIEGEIVYATTADNTIQKVVSGETDYGLVPLENSNGGIVLETVHAMARYVFQIEKILEIDVQQNLITMPGLKMDEITQIVSHQQALAQCKFYLRRNWPTVEMIEYEDTALAAKDLHDGKLSNTTAVIASRTAAELYNLQVLEPSIQDLKFNFTSFLVITK
jgi:prephenate dehydratase